MVRLFISPTAHHQVIHYRLTIILHLWCSRRHHVVPLPYTQSAGAIEVLLVPFHPFAVPLRVEAHYVALRISYIKGLVHYATRLYTLQSAVPAWIIAIVDQRSIITC